MFQTMNMSLDEKMTMHEFLKDSRRESDEYPTLPSQGGGEGNHVIKLELKEMDPEKVTEYFMFSYLFIVFFSFSIGNWFTLIKMLFQHVVYMIFYSRT